MMEKSFSCAESPNVAHTLAAARSPLPRRSQQGWDLTPISLMDSLKPGAAWPAIFVLLWCCIDAVQESEASGLPSLPGWHGSCSASARCGWHTSLAPGSGSAGSAALQQPQAQL